MKYYYSNFSLDLSLPTDESTRTLPGVKQEPLRETGVIISHRGYWKGWIVTQDTVVTGGPWRPVARWDGSRLFRDPRRQCRNNLIIALRGPSRLFWTVLPKILFTKTKVDSVTLFNLPRPTLTRRRHLRLLLVRFRESTVYTFRVFFTFNLPVEHRRSSRRLYVQVILSNQFYYSTRVHYIIMLVHVQNPRLPGCCSPFMTTFYF